MVALFQDKNADAYCQAICNQFSQRAVGDPSDIFSLSWGQFLDNWGNKSQVGLYGTVSACLAFKLTRGAQDINAQSTHNKLAHFWASRQTDSDVANNLAQNIRIAMLLLGLAAKHPFGDNSVQEVWAALKNKLHSTQKMWAASRPPTDPAFQASEYVTAIILLLLYVVRSTSTGSQADFADLDSVRQQSAEALENAFTSDLTLNRPYKSALLLAVYTTRQKSTNKKVRKALGGLALQAIDIKQRYTFFFDYQKADGTFSRDFLIIPTSILFSYILYMEKISGMNYLLATRALSELEKSLKSSPDGLFKAGVERPSTMEQAFTIIALHAFSKHTPLRAAKIWPWLMWRAQKDIENERLAAFFILLGGYLPVALTASAAAIIKSLSGTAIPHSVIYILYAFAATPAWLSTLLAVIASVTGKPQELLKVLFRGKK